jgi:hypothetical protein
MYYQELYKFGYYHGMVPDIDNEQLAEIILDHGRRESEDVADTTHEDFDFPDNEQLRKVIAHIKKEFNYINPERKLILKNYWGHVHDKRESTNMHDHYYPSHPLCFGCAYYVQLLEGAGNFVFNIPESQYTKIRYEITPRVGQFIMFPSWLDHFVTRNYSEDFRISIAFNWGEEDNE